MFNALLLEQNGYPSAGVGYLDFYIPSGRLDSSLSLKVVVLEAKTKAERAKEWLLQARSVLDQSEPPQPTPDCKYCTWASLIARELAVQYLLGHSSPDMVRRYAASCNCEQAARRHVSFSPGNALFAVGASQGRPKRLVSPGVR